MTVKLQQIPTSYYIDAPDMNNIKPRWNKCLAVNLRSDLVLQQNQNSATHFEHNYHSFSQNRELSAYKRKLMNLKRLREAGAGSENCSPTHKDYSKHSAVQRLSLFL